jgi:serine/threonine-protein kinase HipA
VTYTPVDVVEVRAWDRPVGAVTWDPGTRAYAFEYDPGWLADGQELSPLYLPRRPGVFSFPDLSEQTFYRLPPMLADALPDRFGNSLVDAWMAEQGVERTRITPLDRLAYSADRGMGALEFRPPARELTPDGTALQLAELVTAARAALRGDFESASKTAIHDLVRVGTSAGGARPKAVIAFNPITHEIRSGQLDAPDGFEHWIIKLDGVDGDPTRDVDPFTQGAGFGRVEFAYHLMATAAAIEMTECRLLPEGPRTHFLTRRSDRDAVLGRVHVQTLCGLAHLDFNQSGAHSYAQYFETIAALGLGADAREQAFRRVVFNVAAANRDDHTKNLSFLAPHGKDWALAPAYDVIHAHNPSGRWTDRHQMTVNGRRDDIGLSDLAALADRELVPHREDAIKEVLDAVFQWPQFAESAGVDARHIDRIREDLERCRPR